MYVSTPSHSIVARLLNILSCRLFSHFSYIFHPSDCSSAPSLIYSILSPSLSSLWLPSQWSWELDQSFNSQTPISYWAAAAGLSITSINHFLLNSTQTSARFKFVIVSPQTLSNRSSSSRSSLRTVSLPTLSYILTIIRYINLIDLALHKVLNKYPDCSS